MTQAPDLPIQRRLDPRWFPLLATSIGSFMSILDSQIVNIALPNILTHFDASLSSGQLVVTAYVMALAVVIPLSGFLGERVGMKRLYMITLTLFVAGSVLCGLAWSMESLIFFRVLQGLGGGMLMPLGMALMFTMITPLERPRFIAVLGIPALLAPLVGPSLGGFLVEYVSWRMVFLLNVPIGALDLILVYKLIKETPRKSESKLDAPGFILAAIAFPSLLLAMSRGADSGWTSPLVLTLFAVGSVTLVLFVRRELTHHDPMLRLRLFSIPTFRKALILQYFGIFSLFGLNVVVPLYLQRVQGMTAGEAGVILLPAGFAAFFSMNIAGKLYHSLGPRPIVLTGTSILAVTTLGWTFVQPDSASLWLFLLVIGRGLSLGMFAQIVQVAAYNAIPQAEISRATSLTNVGQRIGTAFATAALTTTLIIGLGFTNAPEGTSIAAGTAPISAMAEAFDYAFYLMTAFTIAAFLLALSLHDSVQEANKAQTAQAKAKGATTNTSPTADALRRRSSDLPTSSSETP